MPNDPLSTASPFRQWLETGYIPLDSEVDQVKGFLESHIIRREVLATQIADAKMILDSLKEGRAHLQNAIDAHWSLVHPARRVPKDVWQKIFIYCLPTNHLPVMSATEMPLVLMRVCSLWRDIALSAPIIWSSLHLTIPRGCTPRSHLDVTGTAVQAVHNWLGRSAGEKLSISLHWPQDLVNDYGTQDQFPLTILQYSPTIRALELNLPSDVLYVLLNSDVSSFPYLEEITVRIPTIAGRSCVGGIGIASANIWRVPTLKKVVLESVNAELLDFPLAWTKLEEIEVSGDEAVPTSFFNHDEAFSLTLACARLEKLRIQLTKTPRLPSMTDPSYFYRLLARQTSHGIGSPTQVYLRHLTTLDISDIFVDPRSDTFTFIERLELPALETLKYRLVQHSPTTPFTYIHPLLAFLLAQRHPVTIKAWYVDATSMSRETFINCLALMPQLRKLWIRDERELDCRALGAEQVGGCWLSEEVEREICPDDDMFEALWPLSAEVVTEHSSIRSGGVQPICPLLEKLRVDRANFSLDGIRDFVQLRLVMSMSNSQRQPLFLALQDIQIGLLYLRPASDQVVDHKKDEGSSSGRLEIDLCELGLRAKITFIPAAVPEKEPENADTKPTDGLTINDGGFGTTSVGQ
ncbi:hypothetical protein EST38_g3207 [Candolleomyces aberdarensis]|uniref:F-box domain-containing protein n=1 Tax=Candolleomyces aberdarensis TaxID=2316362 RepID=A0A4Q2DR18_9AGAR|nr:hypothetical protein EST38_g3207 [Candolleomyces aberdarensis]